MDRHYATAEQYDRWFKRDCARCGRHGHFAAHWPDGHVCRTCHDRALRIRGTCPGCGNDAVLAGLAAGAAVCTSCAGFTVSCACSRCGTEGKLHAGRLCTRCALHDRLDELLDDGTGQVRPELLPLHAALLSMANPQSGLTWARRTVPADLLHRLGRGEIDLTHEAFHQLEPWRAAAHLRELLMGCGLLPQLDKHILLFQRWLHAYLPSIEDPAHARTIRQFATWQVLPWMRQRATATGPLGPNTRRHAGSQVRRATDFHQWLDEHDRAPATCTQADLDRWHVEHLGHEHQDLKPFLRWAMSTQRMPRLQVPQYQAGHGTPISQHHRLALIRRLLTDDTIALRTRVAAVLMLLYAQPFTRIVRLTISDILLEDDQVLLRFGTPATPVPEPFAALLLALRDNRDNMATATNRDSPWLFPGRRAGQPLLPEVLGAAVSSLGMPTTTARTAALRQLVLQAPAPVVARMLGYHDKHTARVVAESGGTWSRYAPGDDHARRTP